MLPTGKVNYSETCLFYWSKKKMRGGWTHDLPAMLPTLIGGGGGVTLRSTGTTARSVLQRRVCHRETDGENGSRGYGLRTDREKKF